MSKVKEYIEKYTRRCSNAVLGGEFYDWLTPYHAECVAQIAREEVIEKACEWLTKNYPEGYWTGGEWLDYIEDFRKIMKGE